MGFVKGRKRKAKPVATQIQCEEKMTNLFAPISIFSHPLTRPTLLLCDQSGIPLVTLITITLILMHYLDNFQWLTTPPQTHIHTWGRAGKGEGEGG